MVWRAIVRFSLNKDNGVIGTHANGLLLASGFVRIGTGSWERKHDDLPGLMDMVGELLNVLRNPTAAKQSAPEGVVLDHVWLYVNQEPE